jgi:hypothetical protein
MENVTRNIRADWEFNLHKNGEQFSVTTNLDNIEKGYKNIVVSTKSSYDFIEIEDYLNNTLNHPEY